jgi:hypothetical protein
MSTSSSVPMRKDSNIELGITPDVAKREERDAGGVEEKGVLGEGPCPVGAVNELVKVEGDVERGVIEEKRPGRKGWLDCLGVCVHLRLTRLFDLTIHIGRIG